MQPRALHQHDLITDLEPSAQDRACSFGDHPHRAAGQLELVWLDQLRQRRGLAATPGGAGVDAPFSPARKQPGVPGRLLIPGRGSGGEVRIDDEW